MNNQPFLLPFMRTENNLMYWVLHYAGKPA